MVTSVNPYRSLKLYGVSISRVWSNTFINQYNMLITLSKFTKTQKKRPSSVATSFLLSFLPFVIFPKHYQEHSPEVETAFSRSFLALTVAALRRRCALAQYFPSPQTSSFFGARKLFWSGLMCLIDTLIFKYFNNDSTWFFFHYPHLMGQKTWGHWAYRGAHPGGSRWD